MQIKDFIKAKQDLQKLSNEDINYFIKNLNNFSQEEITAWLKAVKANGLDNEETTALTLAMANSGKILSWEGLEPVLDKHSTGGIGDKITLLFVPLVAAYGINIPKLSGRSLGITGGTIDKLESINGFRTNLSIEEIKNQVKKIGLAEIARQQTLNPDDFLTLLTSMVNNLDNFKKHAVEAKKMINPKATQLVVEVLSDVIEKKEIKEK